MKKRTSENRTTENRISQGPAVERFQKSPNEAKYSKNAINSIQ